MTPAQTEEATALAEILCEIFWRQGLVNGGPTLAESALDAEFDDITDNTLTQRIKLLQ